MNLLPAVLESAIASVCAFAVTAAVVVHKRDSKQPVPANYQTLGMYVRHQHLGLPTEMPQPATSGAERCRRRLIAAGKL